MFPLFSSVKPSSQASWAASQPKSNRSANHSSVSYGSKDKRSTSRVRLVNEMINPFTRHQITLSPRHLRTLDIAIDA